MKWGYKSIIFIVFFLLLFSFLFSFTVGAYSEQDLWILEVIVNQNSFGGQNQTLDALVIEDKAFLPLVPVANMLEIKLNIDNEKGIYIFNRPGDGTEVKINKKNEEIIVKGNPIEVCNKMYQINGKLYLRQDCLAQSMDASFEYDSAHLIVSVKTDNIKKKAQEQSKKPPLKKEKEKQENKEEKPFTISNITYNWNSSWEKDKSKIKTAETVFGETGTEVEEDWGTFLDLNAKGTLYDWRYQLGVSNELEKDDNFSTTLDHILFIYDMDKATFKVGKLGVRTEDELQLDDTEYYGLSLTSRVSPLMGTSGNLIQVKGDAPAGSIVTLYVNDWETAEQEVGTEEEYLFEDILVYQRQRANELKVKIEKPDGQVEEKYRYVTASNVILQKNKFNYLTQLGELNSDQKEDNYFLNSIAYWGATDKTTLGLGLYGEVDKDVSFPEDNPVYNFGSLRLNQRLGDKFIFKSVLYQNQNKMENDSNSDLGYRLNLDYWNRIIQSGVEYHHQAEQLNYIEKERLEPNKVLKFYYLQDVTPDSVLQGKYTRYSEINNPEQEEEIYEAGYKIKHDQWKAGLNFEKDIDRDPEETRTDNWQGTFSYLITPNIELLSELGYEARWDDVLTENVNLGLQGLVEMGANSYLMRVDFNKELDENETNTDYQLSWTRKWSLTEDSNIQTKIGYEYETENNFRKIPLRVGYSHGLEDDRKVNLNYQGIWKENDNREDIEHRVTLSYSGAFNLFGGKMVSTSPWAFDSKVGMVSGVVFKDRNRNGQFDKGEEVLSDIPVKLNRKVKFTDQEGKFEFKQVAAGKHRLNLDFDQLPVVFTPSTGEKNIEVTPNETVEENLGLYIVGTVDGKVETTNYEQQIPLSGIKITADPGGYSVYTDYRGYYFFDQLPVGEYEINIDETTLPDWVKLENRKSYKIKITDQGEYLSGKNFKVKIKPDKIR